MSLILPLFHQTSIVFIDDDLEMLKNLIKVLDYEKNSNQIFEYPQQAIEYINANTYRDNLIKRLVPHDEEENLYYQQDAFAREILNSQRYEQISALVIDYDMPGQNGLQVCQAINNPYIKKILLTGAADEKIVIKAFNEGLIHQYIRKQDPDFIDHLQRSIRVAQYDYFQEISVLPLKILTTRVDSTSLIDPAFNIYFHQLIRTHNIIEYYLVEGMGSFILVDNQHKVYSLITLDDGLIDMYLSSKSIERLTGEQIQLIKEKKIIPCYYNPFSKPNTETLDLSKFLYEPTIIQGYNKFYYCVFGQGLIPVGSQSIALLNLS